jgi:hypothetical protein
VPRPPHSFWLITRTIYGEEYNHEAPHHVVFTFPLLRRPC